MKRILVTLLLLTAIPAQKLCDPPLVNCREYRQQYNITPLGIYAIVVTERQFTITSYSTDTTYTLVIGEDL